MSNFQDSQNFDNNPDNSQFIGPYSAAFPNRDLLLKELNEAVTLSYKHSRSGHSLIQRAAEYLLERQAKHIQHIVDQLIGAQVTPEEWNVFTRLVQSNPESPNDIEVFLPTFMNMKYFENGISTLSHLANIAQNNPTRITIANLWPRRVCVVLAKVQSSIEAEAVSELVQEIDSNVRADVSSGLRALVSIHDEIVADNRPASLRHVRHEISNNRSTNIKSLVSISNAISQSDFNIVFPRLADPICQDIALADITSWAKIHPGMPRVVTDLLLNNAKESGDARSDRANCFIETSCKISSKKKDLWEESAKIASIFSRREWNVSEAFEKIDRNSDQLKTAKLIARLSEVADRLNFKNPIFLEHFVPIPVEYADAWVGSLHALESMEKKPISVDNLRDCFRAMILAGVETHVTAKVATALSMNEIRNPEDLERLSRNLVVHSITLAVVGRDNTNRSVAIKDVLQVWTKNDHVPYWENDPRAKQMRKEIRIGLRRMIDTAYGFREFTFEARSLPDGDLWTLAQAGRDLGSNVSFINAKRIDRFPGRGVILEGITPELVVPGPENDPTANFRKMVAPLGAQDEVGLMDRTALLFSRYLIGVTAPDKSFSLDGVRYTYLVQSEQLNPWLDLGAFCPTEIITECLNDCLIPMEEYQGFDSDRSDINSRSLTFAGLQRACERKGLNFLNLGWGPVVGGGFCNAYPPDSAPYFEWEKAARPHETTDYFRRVHKSHILGGYKNQLIPELEAAFVPFREAHEKVYSVLRRYQNLLDLFRISLAHWHMGSTLTIDGNEQFAETADSETEMRINPNTFRMLKFAYLWHNELRQTTANDIAYPVLAVVRTLDVGGRPKPLATLDTLTMKLHVKTDGKEKVIQLPLNGSGRGEREEFLWMQNVMPLFRSDRDLKFYDRREF